MAELLYNGDSLHVLKTMEDNSVDSVVTDPPYGLSKEPDIGEVLTKWLGGKILEPSEGEQEENEEAREWVAKEFGDMGEVMLLQT